MKSFFCLFVSINYKMRVNGHLESGSVSVDFHVSQGRIFSLSKPVVKIEERDGTDDVPFGRG